ncbi:unnamed protein product [Symbiodinium sp. CCMP2592]|nr:unnamed protein product [Symbiodinium sp. CCMP2592]
MRWAWLCLLPPLGSGQPGENSSYQEVKKTSLIRWVKAEGSNWDPFVGRPAQVVAVADHFLLVNMVCNLARTVEFAGGFLRVVGLPEEVKLPGNFAAQQEAIKERSAKKEGWDASDFFGFFGDAAWRALRRIQSNETVAMVDAFDVSFQRSLEDMVAIYEELAAPAAKRTGAWPVILGGEMNCYPFPHNGSFRLPRRKPAHGNLNTSWVYRIPRTAHFELKPEAKAARAAKYYPSRSRPSGTIGAAEVCQEWLRQHADTFVADRQRHVFPFVNGGAQVGRASAMKRLWWRTRTLYRQTGETDSQALLQLVLLEHPELGMVDFSGRLFLALHGHGTEDLERELCTDDYFVPRGRQSAVAVPAYLRRFNNLYPPPLRRRSADEPPVALHFNGNGKRFLRRCLNFFRQRLRIDGPRIGCSFFDQDSEMWFRFG